VQTNHGFSLVQVLRYKSDDLRGLSLGPGLRWVPEIEGDGNKVVNLHIFAEPPTREFFAHNHHLEEAFEDLVSLFPGLDLKLTGDGTTADATLVPEIGLPEEHQITMSERTTPCDSGEVGNSNCPPIVLRTAL
jgi:hypothetical protein